MNYQYLVRVPASFFSSIEKELLPKLLGVPIKSRAHLNTIVLPFRSLQVIITRHLIALELKDPNLSR